MTMETTTTIKGKEYRIRLQFETITPERAEDLLGTTIGNRGTGLTQVARFTRAMTAGQWILECSPIRISDTGKLIDGHHRLEGVIASGVAQEFLVMYGLPEEVFIALDQNKTRSTKDTFAVAGETNASYLGAAIKHLWRFINSVEHRSACSNVEAAVLLDKHPNIRDSLLVATELGNQIHSPIGVMTAVHYVITSSDAKKSNDFFNGLLYGIGDIFTNPTDPRTKLRAKILREHKPMMTISEGRRVGGITWKELKVAFWVMESWLYFIDGTPLLYWSKELMERNVLNTLYSMAQDVHAQAQNPGNPRIDIDNPRNTAADSIVRLMEHRATWTGKTGDLLSILSSDYGLKGMTVQKFGYHLTKPSTAKIMKNHGIERTKYTYKGNRVTQLIKPSAMAPFKRAR